MVKVCFVCTGNTCRSIMAERLMKRIMKERKIDNIKVSSKGINASGENISENAKIVLKQNKALSSNRKSVKLKKIEKDTLYIVMTEKMKSYVKAPLILAARDLIGEDVIDPYSQDIEAYQKTANQIQNVIVRLLDKINIWREV